MNAKKLYALLGGLMVAGACLPPVTFAEDAKKASNDEGVNRAEIGTHTRHIKLSEIKKHLQTQSAKPVAAPSLKPKASVETSNTVATSNPKPPTKPVIATGKHAPKQNQTQLAIYKNQKNNANSVVAVSHSVFSTGTSPVVEATLNRPGTLPKYRSGEKMVIKLKALQECNVMVWDFDSNGALTQIFPNAYEPNGRMSAGQTMELGGEGSQYTLDLDGAGMERVFVYAYPVSVTDKPVEVAMVPIPNTPFRSGGKMTKEQFDRLIASTPSYKFLSNSSDRGIKVVGKPQAVKVSNPSEPAENKLELHFQIVK